MKKILVTIAIATIVAASSHAQGLVIFTSSTQNMSTNNSLAALGSTASGRTQGVNAYYYALFVSPTATTVGGSSAAEMGLGGTYAFNDANWTLDTDPTASAASTATVGRFASTTANADGSTVVPGVAAGNAAQFVVVGWSANLGTTVAALRNAMATPGMSGFLGESVVSGAITTGNGALLPTPSLFQPSAPAMQGFSLGSFSTTTVPEPTTLALAALGSASLLLFRRKK